MKTLDEVISALPVEEQEKINARTAELLAEELTLQELRKAKQRSQAAMAKRLRVNQAAVSKLERRADMYVSTLRSFIEAMGGSLEIIARFPDHPPVKITQFAALHVESEK
ncbi:MAG: transcriptional regulator [Candidatus Omnitrophota bacterium]|jgi:DNA-binding XRE family transcriptional regulator|nr:MAG: transcriptional regulator [Candidatus Omnitrophota bacterium]